MPDLLNAVETAEELDCSTETVARLARTGELPGTKLGGRTGAWVFDAAVVRMFKQQAQKSPGARKGARGRTRPRLSKEATASCPQ